MKKHLGDKEFQCFWKLLLGKKNLLRISWTTKKTDNWTNQIWVLIQGTNGQTQIILLCTYAKTLFPGNGSNAGKDGREKKEIKLEIGPIEFIFASKYGSYI